MVILSILPFHFRMHYQYLDFKLVLGLFGLSLSKGRNTDPKTWRDILSIRDEVIYKSGGLNAAKGLMDIWCSNQSLCTAKIYQFFSGRGVTVRKLSVLWESLAVPKHRMVAWMAHKGRLATIDNLQRKGMILVNRCVLCCNAVESHSRLFFQCSYVSEVWGLILCWLGCHRRPRSFQRELEWCFKTAKQRKGIHKIYRAAFVAVVYHCWIERNNRVFRDVEVISSLLCRKIKFDIFCRLYSLVPHRMRNEFSFLAN